MKTTEEKMLATIEAATRKGKRVDRNVNDYIHRHKASGHLSREIGTAWKAYKKRKFNGGGPAAKKRSGRVKSRKPIQIGHPSILDQLGELGTDIRNLKEKLGAYFTIKEDRSVRRVLLKRCNKYRRQNLVETTDREE